MNVACPKCGRFLLELGTVAGTTGRTICRDCSVEVAVRVKGKVTA